MLLSRSVARRDALAAAWARHVGPPRLVDGSSAEGLAVLDLWRGDDPFAVTSQQRVQWR